jgi:hypothetical protein
MTSKGVRMTSKVTQVAGMTFRSARMTSKDHPGSADDLQERPDDL